MHLIVEDKLIFLREYKDNVQILSANEIKKINKNLIPDNWRVCEEKDTHKKIKMIMAYWKKYSGNELQNTISYLHKHLEDIEIIKVKHRYSLLYTIENENGNKLYYEGRNPKEKFNNEVVEKPWNKFPDSLKKFYEHVHNGFYDYTSESMGLVPLESVTYLDDYEWGIIEELQEPLKLDLKTSFGFFSNGMGDHVVFDYNDCSNDNATLWFHDDQPNYRINFWNVVDEWMVLGFQT